MSGHHQPRLSALGAVLAGAALLVLASCGGGQRIPPPGAASSGRSGRAVALSVEATAALSSPERYMTLAASSSLFSIRASEIAVSRLSDFRLRAVADEIAREQLGISGQLSFAGRRLNLLPSAALTPLHQSMLDELRGAANFDATYKRQQTAILSEALALHRAYVTRGSSPTLRPVSQMAAPILGREVTALRKL